MVTYTFTNGTVADADEVNQNFTDVETKFYADNTGGTIFNSTTETDLASFTILQNTLGSNASIMINTVFRYTSNIEGERSSTFRLYINGAVVKSRVMGVATFFNEPFGFITYLATGLDVTAGDIEVKVTAQNSDADSGRGSEVFELTGIAKNG